MITTKVYQLTTRHIKHGGEYVPVSNYCYNVYLFNIIIHSVTIYDIDKYSASIMFKKIENKKNTKEIDNDRTR